MSKYVCPICGYVYDEAAGVKWDALPDTFICPLCGASKSEFTEMTDAPQSKAPAPAPAYHDGEALRELSFGELAAVCSNLAKGCEKQYLVAESELFGALAAFFTGERGFDDSTDLTVLKVLLEEDIAAYPTLNALCAENADRGALRALVWGEKATRMLLSILNRYEKQGTAAFEGTGVFVCDICGFVYIGDEPPAVCPVCKVPSFKILPVRKEAV